VAALEVPARAALKASKDGDFTPEPQAVMTASVKYLPITPGGME